MSKRLNMYKGAGVPRHHNARWERDVRKQAFKGYQWLILGPVLGVFAAVAVLLVFK